MPLGLQITLFIRHYGADEYFNPARWPTRDGYIPFRRFFLGYDAIRRHQALERLNFSEGYLLGRVRTYSGDKPVGRNAVADTLDEAFGV